MFLKPEINENIQTYFLKLQEAPPPYLILLIQAESASYAFCELGNIIEHKVNRAYTVRKKQGKSQEKHLRQKGKSRLGSRIRLQQSEKFYKAINQNLQKWEFIIPSAEYVFYHADVRVLHSFFEINQNCIIQKNDRRLSKLPFDVKRPNYDELNRINYLMNTGHLTIFDESLNIHDFL